MELSFDAFQDVFNANSAKVEQTFVSLQASIDNVRRDFIHVNARIGTLEKLGSRASKLGLDSIELGRAWKRSSRVISRIFFEMIAELCSYVLKNIIRISSIPPLRIQKSPCDVFRT